MLSRRILTGVAVVVDVALLARGRPVSARTLAERLGRTPRHLEGLLQDLVRLGYLKGTRGPRGGYELARERRRITLGAIVRSLGAEGGGAAVPTPARLVEDVLEPALAGATERYLVALDRLTVQDMTDAAEGRRGAGVSGSPGEFHI